MRSGRQVVTMVAMSMLLGTASIATAQDKEVDRVKESATVLREVLDVPDDIPAELLDRAECVIVFPSVKKFAIGIGGSYGRGVMTCRGGDAFRGPWGPPTMMALEGGSIGFQLGGQATDFVLLVMNDRGANGVLTSKTRLGAAASAAAGPKGRAVGAATDATMRAEILTYSRSRGLFAGVSLEGSSLRPDEDANTKLYERKVSPREIVKGSVTIPAAAQPLVDLLNQRSPKNKSEK